MGSMRSRELPEERRDTDLDKTTRPLCNSVIELHRSCVEMEKFQATKTGLNGRVDQYRHKKSAWILRAWESLRFVFKTSSCCSCVFSHKHPPGPLCLVLKSGPVNLTQHRWTLKKTFWILIRGSEYLSVPTALRKWPVCTVHIHTRSLRIVRVASGLPCLSALVLANTMLA